MKGLHLLVAVISALVVLPTRPASADRAGFARRRFVFYLLGHEYGHGIQQPLGIQYQYTIYQELQADCFAGAYIGDSVKVGDLSLEAGDLDELCDGLLSVGDPPEIAVHAFALPPVPSRLSMRIVAEGVR